MSEDRLSCPRCGCAHVPVIYTRHRGGFVQRVRECRHCGRRMVTREKLAGMVAKALTRSPVRTDV